MRFVYSIIVFILCAYTSYASISSIDNIIDKAIAEGRTSGASVLVYHEGRIIHKKIYGYAHEDMKEPLTSEHLFDLSSLTKVFGTTMAIMRLVDDGVLDVDDPVHYYLPEFRFGNKKKVTVRHLLTHTSGLPQWVPVYFHADNPRLARRYVLGLPLKFNIGERHYSDVGFMLLGYIVQEISGKPIDEFLEKTVFKSLYLKHTMYNPLEKEYYRICATSYGNPFERQMIADNKFGHVPEDPSAFKKWRKDVLKGEVNDGNAFYAHKGVAGHAGLFSTADDLLKLTETMLACGKFRGRTIFSCETVKEFFRKDKNGQAFGWVMNGKLISAVGGSPYTYGHLGFTGTNVAVDPAKRLVVILLTNRQQKGLNSKGYYPWLGSLRRAVFKAALEAVR